MSSLYIIYFRKVSKFSTGLVDRISRSHRDGLGSIPCLEKLRFVSADGCLL